MAKVVLTSTLIPVSDQDLRVFDGLTVEFTAVDGTSEAALMDATRDADAIIVLAEHITRPVIENLQRCRSITRFGIGVDTVDVEAATEHGIWVNNVPDANYREVATHAVALALALTRRLPLYDKAVKTEGWASPMTGLQIRRADDQVFGLLGMGRIGKRVAAAANAIGFTVITYDPVLTIDAAAELGVELVTMGELVARSNVLSLHVPLTEETRNIIDSSVLRSMPSGAVLINVSRGGLIDEAALADALRGGHLAGAGLDVFTNEPLETTSPLRTLDNVLLSPHSAHASREAWDETRRRVLEETARVLRGQAPKHPVNTPASPRKQVSQA